MLYCAVKSLDSLRFQIKVSALSGAAQFGITGMELIRKCCRCLFSYIMGRASRVSLYQEVGKESQSYEEGEMETIHRFNIQHC